MVIYLDSGPGYHAKRNGTDTDFVDPEEHRLTRPPGGAILERASIETRGKPAMRDQGWQELRETPPMPADSPAVDCKVLHVEKLGERPKQVQEAYRTRSGGPQNTRHWSSPAHPESRKRYTMAMTITDQAASKTAKEEHIPSLGDLLRIIWNRLWVIAVIAIVVTGVAVGYNLMQTPEYEASISILIAQEQESDRPGELAGEIQGLQQITQTMVEAVDSRPVAEAVIRQLNLDLSPQNFLNQHLNVEQVGATQFIQVDYRDQNPQRAQQAANTIGDVFSERVSEVSPSANAITATVWERATVPEDPVSPKPMRTVPLALMLGLMLGVGLAFLLEYLDDSWRSPEEAEQISGVPTFGVIPQFEAVTASTKKGKQGTG